MKYFSLLLFFSLYLNSQNTVGVITNESGVFNGYTLFTPNTSKKTYLINNCGEIVHQWNSTSNPGNSVYLLESGNLLRAGKVSNPDISFGGVGGKVEILDWNSNVIWEYIYSTPQVSQHHDIFPLPNGNVLMLAVSTLNEAEAIQAGRNPSLINQGKLFNEQILELKPNLTSGSTEIVWEWHIKDHLVQDFDSTKSNFGVIADNEQLLDINYLNNNPNGGSANWLHFNSIQYNSNLDQIIISSRLMNEIYIIDHSTTTNEASSNSGGTYGKGGDFLYRWGNPEAYDHGDIDDTKLFGQHFAHWIPDGFSDAGKVIIFNNGGARNIDMNNLPINYSSIDIIDPPQSSNGVYIYDENNINGYGPIDSEWNYVNPVDPKNFYSPILSGAQRLSNGNTLICSGSLGYFFEIDSNNDIVWEYINPDSSNGIIAQGDIPSANPVFRATKLPFDYPAFTGKDLTPRKTIESGTSSQPCSLLTNNSLTFNKSHIFPNPTSNILNIQINKKIKKLEVYSTLGEILIKNYNENRINLSQLPNGLYIIKIFTDNSSFSQKILKH
ncbi:aryl-sulfate sulfotransferase [uncultured Algibacter sp.]|uniref:aryl-sulfate sulfotransferase n=1 Tax=uncultured Algibacter sp. TaxID=298659 RepID=UPI00262B2F22|nr:aryl-sulfate sulfotransferase [uncultured Algibacter sp.]